VPCRCVKQRQCLQAGRCRESVPRPLEEESKMSGSWLKWWRNVLGSIAHNIMGTCSRIYDAKSARWCSVRQTMTNFQASSCRIRTLSRGYAASLRSLTLLYVSTQITENTTKTAQPYGSIQSGKPGGERAFIICHEKQRIGNR
jgi:hypothetical protein